MCVNLTTQLPQESEIFSSHPPVGMVDFEVSSFNFIT